MERSIWEIKSATVPAIIDIIIHWYLNLFGKNNANVRGIKTAVARSPIDKNPKSLINEPENVAATNTDISNITTIVSRDTLRFLEESALEQYKYHKFNNNLDDEGINIMSIHKSKGLEFHTVFILGMEKGEFPSTYNGGRKYYNLLGEYFKKNAKKYESNIEDERKLLNK